MRKAAPVATSIGTPPISCSERGRPKRRCYVTNAVKHFKFTPRGKRRIHAKPNAGEVQACAWWLAAELRLIKPKLAVALGATALYALLGRQAKVTRDRGTMLRSPDGLPVLVTIHPSALLRTLDQPDAELNRGRFVDDLKKIAEFLE
ncbi:uracil-DNA glycosylase family protein [Neorhizobium galegae]|uniref:uracil-DNA glycosylase family protein n=1 Tax=Neorhizobium galegae TaxID=399 RepID=UPI00349E8AEC